MSGLAKAHGLDRLIAPVRPTWKERYPLTPIENYVLWRREDGFHYDPWIRTHERLGAEILSPAPKSMTVIASRGAWEEWTALQFPEDGDYVVPGALVPVRFEGGRERMSNRTSGCGIRPDPYRYGHGQAARRVDAG